MSLVHDYDHHLERVGSGLDDEDVVVIDGVHTSTSLYGGAAPAPELLSVETNIRQASRGRGHLVCVAACNDVVMVATSRGYVLRYQWDDYGNEKVTEVEVVRAGPGGSSGAGAAGGDTCVTGLYMDPMASHAIITVRVQGMAETHYLHHRWAKAKPLSKLRGMRVTCVAWPPPLPLASQVQRKAKTARDPKKGGNEQGGEEESAWLSSECTGPVLLGTDSGLVHEVVVDADKWAAKKEPHAPHQVLDLRDARKEVHTIEQSVSLPDGGGRLVLLSTSHALYALRAAMPGVPLEALPDSLHPRALHLSTQADAPAHALFPVPPVLEAPPPPNPPSPAATPQHRPGAPSARFNQLLLLHPGGFDPTRFAWRVGPLVYHGELSSAATTPSAPKPPPIPSPSAFPSSSFASAAAAAAAAAAAPGSAEQGGMGVGPKKQPGEGILRGVEVLPLVADAAGGLEGEGGAVDEVEELRSMVMTQFHFVVLVADRLRAINRVSGRCVAEVGFRTPLLSARTVSGLPGSRAVDGLVMDPITRTMYMYSDESLYEVVMRAEARDMWRVYLEKQEWDAALQMCQSPSQRDEVHNTTAETMFNNGNFDEAARHWAKLSGASPPFEDIALRLVAAEAPRAIRVFLATKLAILKSSTARTLDRVGSDPAVSVGRGSSQGLTPAAALLAASAACTQPEHAQATMVASWLTELLLDSINRELLESGGKPSPSYRAAEQQLHDFLCENVDVLDVGTTTGLLGAYGRLEELLAYAQARGDHEAVLEALLQRPGGALRALAVLRKPSCPRELVYRFAPALMADAPEDTVDALIAANPPLEPRRLIPAMLRFASPVSPASGRAAVLRYLTYAVDGPPRCQDSAVHDLVVALCALADDEADLLTYLARARKATGVPLYDPKYALRRAQERGKDKATVRLLCELGMHSDAVRVACAHNNLGLAKAVAAAAPDEELVLGGPEGKAGGAADTAVSPSSTRRRLWLAIARHVVQQQGSDADGPDQVARQTAAIKQAVDLLKEAEGLLQIEDVLPFFPNFVTIDNFKDAICDSLEQYNKQIEHLKAEMEEATGIADAVRADLSTLKGRVAVVQADQGCARCGVGLLLKPPASALAGLPSGGAVPPVYVFPSGLAYHGACCAAEAQPLMLPQQRGRLRKVMSRLARTHTPQGHLQPPLAPASQPSQQQQQAAQAPEELKPAAGEGETQVLIHELHQLVASEDPRNGEMLVQLVDMEYVDPQEDAAEAASWRCV